MSSGLGQVIGGIGGAVGGLMLGGVGGLIRGAALGSAIVGSFGEGKTGYNNLGTKQGSRIADLRVQLSSYGKVIPQVYGSMRLAGNIIWARDIKEVAQEHTESYSETSGGKGGGGRRTTVISQTTVTYSYSATLAIAICKGPIDDIVKIWADSLLLDDKILSSAQGKFNTHLGTDTQNFDSIIGIYEPCGTYPAYRDLAYVVIEDFPLEQFGNRIPNFSFEVKSSAKY